MKLPDPELWQKLREFSISPPDTQLSFTQRLARENGWTEFFAAGVVHEYKKFIYLLCVTNEALTPSEEVDQAWHLHLAYARNYWEELCDGILQRRIYHTPTEGGAVEAEKFWVAYALTLQRYSEIFGEPPASFWPSVENRFSNQALSVRVPINSYQVFDKELFKPGKIVLILAMILALCLSGTPRVIGISVAITVVLGMVALRIYSPEQFNFFPEPKKGDDGGGINSGACGGSGCNSGCGGGGCGGD